MKDEQYWHLVSDALQKCRNVMELNYFIRLYWISSLTDGLRKELWQKATELHCVYDKTKKIFVNKNQS